MKNVLENSLHDFELKISEFLKTFEVGLTVLLFIETAVL